MITLETWPNTKSNCLRAPGGKLLGYSILKAQKIHFRAYISCIISKFLSSQSFSSDDLVTLLDPQFPVLIYPELFEKCGEGGLCACQCEYYWTQVLPLCSVVVVVHIKILICLFPQRCPTLWIKRACKTRIKKFGKLKWLLYLVNKRNMLGWWELSTVRWCQ